MSVDSIIYFGGMYQLDAESMKNQGQKYKLITPPPSFPRAYFHCRLQC